LIPAELSLLKDVLIEYGRPALQAIEPPSEQAIIDSTRPAWFTETELMGLFSSAFEVFVIACLIIWLKSLGRERARAAGVGRRSAVPHGPCDNSYF
jgi:hypothetical protein